MPNTKGLFPIIGQSFPNAPIQHETKKNQSNNLIKDFLSSEIVLQKSINSQPRKSKQNDEKAK